MADGAGMNVTTLDGTEPTAAAPAPAPPDHPAGPRGRLRRFWQGPPGDPAWARPSLLGLLAATGVLYLWNLSASGYANDFYAAAAQAGSQNWKAWLFASLDAGNAITVDKPPAALWVMGLSARIFGVSSWSILAPQALIGVATVAILYATVRRWFGPAAGLAAGAILALTPVAVLMFRFDNPDALLVLLMTAGAYATVRAAETASWKWLSLAGIFLGFGFLTKMLQAFLVLPAFALVYLVCAPTGLGRRIRDLLIAGAAVVVSGGWFVLLVSLWPASSRPYIAGSTNNSLWQLAIGYNGLGRILGGDGNRGGGGGGFGGGGGNVSFGGAPGIGRLFGASFGAEISWLLPAALIAFAGLLVFTGKAPRTDRTRAAAILWGGWLIVSGVTFSFMSGTIHPYYMVALAPAIGALVAVGARVLWTHRSGWAGRALLSAMVLATAVWDFVLLGRNTWAPGLRWAILLVGIVAAAALLAPGGWLRRFTVVAVVAAVASTGAGTAAWAVATAATPHTGATPSSGPASAAGNGFGPGGGRGGFRGGFPPGGFPGGTTPGGTTPGGATPGGTIPGSTTAGGAPQIPAGGGRGGFGGNVADPQLVALLKAATGSRWAAAATGSQEAGPLELASDTSIMAIGGFTGGDPSPTLAQFQAYVAAGDIHYYLGGGGFGGGRGGGIRSGDRRGIRSRRRQRIGRVDLLGRALGEVHFPERGHGRVAEALGRAALADQRQLERAVSASDRQLDREALVVDLDFLLEGLVELALAGGQHGLAEGRAFDARLELLAVHVIAGRDGPGGFDGLVVERVDGELEGDLGIEEIVGERGRELNGQQQTENNRQGGGEEGFESTAHAAIIPDEKKPARRLASLKQASAYFYSAEVSPSARSTSST